MPVGPWFTDKWTSRDVEVMCDLKHDVRYAATESKQSDPQMRQATDRHSSRIDLTKWILRTRFT
jgi:hypothetical protein